MKQDGILRETDGLTVPAWFWQVQDIDSAAERDIVAKVAMLTNEENPTTFCSLTYLAKIAYVSKRTALRIVNGLCDKGLLERVPLTEQEQAERSNKVPVLRLKVTDKVTACNPQWHKQPTEEQAAKRAEKPIQDFCRENNIPLDKAQELIALMGKTFGDQQEHKDNKPTPATPSDDSAKTTENPSPATPSDDSAKTTETPSPAIPSDDVVSSDNVTESYKKEKQQLHSEIKAYIQKKGYERPRNKVILDELNKFYEYWTAPLKNGRNIGHCLYVEQRTFSLSSRISTWMDITGGKKSW